MYYENSGEKLYYERYGTTGKTIVILPGWGETRHTFQYMIDYLQTNFIVYIVDYPGFGNSPFPSHDLTIYDYTNLILDFLIDQQIERPILIGHSFGGRIAITLTGYLSHPVDKLILIGSAGIKPKKSFRQKLRTRIYKILKKGAKLLPKNRRKNYLEKLINHFGSKDYQNLNANQRKTFIQVINEDLKPYLKDIKVPTLLIWGNNDTDTPLKDGVLMHQKIKDSGLVIIPNATHFCYLEQPVLVHSIIGEFLSEEKDND